MQGRKIAVLDVGSGAEYHIVAALLSKGIHTITAISFTDSTSTFPDEIHLRRGSYDDQNFLDSALMGHDVLILPVGSMSYETEVTILQAGARAQVPYILPCEFASDHRPGTLDQGTSLMTSKDKYRNLINELGVSQWIGIVSEPWFDWSFRIKHRNPDHLTNTDQTFEVHDTKTNLASLKKTAKAVAGMLSLPEPELAVQKHAFVYVGSFHVSQHEIFDSVIRDSEPLAVGQAPANEPAAGVAQACNNAVRGNAAMRHTELLLATIFKERFGNYYETEMILFDPDVQDFVAVVKELVDGEAAD